MGKIKGKDQGELSTQVVQEERGLEEGEKMNLLMKNKLRKNYLVRSKKKNLMRKYCRELPKLLNARIHKELLLR